MNEACINEAIEDTTDGIYVLTQHASDEPEDVVVVVLKGIKGLVHPKMKILSLTIDSSTVERVSSTKFLGMHITEDLTWTTNTCHSPRRHNSTYTFSAGWKEQVSHHPSSPHSTGAPLRVCWPAASLSGTGTAVLLTARHSSGQWTQLQRSSVPLSHPSWTFSLHDAPAKPTASWRTPPTPPTVSSSSYHQEDGTGASEPAPPGSSTAFFPQAVRALNSDHPRPPLKPHANPYPLKHGHPPPPPLQTPP